MHRHLLHNDAIRDTAEHLLSPGQVGLLNGWGVFSTLRVVDGALFAYPRHFARMARDAKLLHVPFPDSPDWLESRLLRLVAANEAWNSTLRVTVVRNKGGMFEGPGIERDFDLIAFTKDLRDWGTSARLAVAPQARHATHAFAGTKMLSWSFNLVMLEQAAARGYDEVVLLNERGEVSECTSANLFATFGGEVATPPLDSGCLPGITRAVLLEEIRVPGLRFAERALTMGDLERADRVFMTSSTRNVLPVDEIEGVSLNRRGDAVQRLADAFEERLRSYAPVPSV